MDSAAAALPRRSAWGASSSPSSSVFLLGSAYTLRQDKHVRVDVFYGRLSRQGKAWIDLVGGFVFLLPFVQWFIICWVVERWVVSNTANWYAAGGEINSLTASTA